MQVQLRYLPVNSKFEHNGRLYVRLEQRKEDGLIQVYREEDSVKLMFSPFDKVEQIMDFDEVNHIDVFLFIQTKYAFGNHVIGILKNAAKNFKRGIITSQTFLELCREELEIDEWDVVTFIQMLSVKSD